MVEFVEKLLILLFNQLSLLIQLFLHLPDVARTEIDIPRHLSLIVLRDPGNIVDDLQIIHLVLNGTVPEPVAARGLPKGRITIVYD